MVLVYSMRKEILLKMKNCKITSKFKIYLLITLVWIIVIFSFSLQPAEVSSEMSSGFGKKLLETFLPELLEEFETMSGDQLGLLHHLLRKCAHFAEYFVLGALVMMTLLQTVLHCKLPIGIGVSMLVASVDETVQRFVPGRSGQVTDVLLDTIGAGVGVLAVHLVVRWMTIKYEISHENGGNKRRKGKN